MASEKLTGILIFQMDGVSMRSKDKGSIEMGGYERKPQYADGKLIGYTETPIAAKVECTSVHGSKTNVDKLHNAVSVSITCVTDTGKKYLVANAFSTRPGKLTGGEGDLSLEFVGDPAVEV